MSIITQQGSGVAVNESASAAVSEATITTISTDPRIDMLIAAGSVLIFVHLSWVTKSAC